MKYARFYAGWLSFIAVVIAAGIYAAHGWQYVLGYFLSGH